MGVQTECAHMDLSSLIINQLIDPFSETDGGEKMKRIRKKMRTRLINFEDSNG